ncbi:MAG: MerR family transcriptional regulator [Myxococcota bacterium]
MEDDGTLTLSIGAVSRATGIPSNTLRTWERRYGFPKPLRTDGGQRSYPASVVAHLTEVARALERGLRPRDVLTANREDLRRWAMPDATVVGGEEVDPLLGAVRALDAESLVRSFEVLWAHRGAVPFLDQVAGPFLQKVGDEWATGRLEVFQEHFASEVLRNFLTRHWRPLADTARGPIVVCASPPGERHDLGLHFVATTLALSGRRIAFLGADVPVDSILGACRSLAPEALAMSVSTSAPADATLEALTELRDGLPPGIGLLLGGAGAPRIDGTIALSSCEALDLWARPGA